MKLLIATFRPASLHKAQHRCRVKSSLNRKQVSTLIGPTHKTYVTSDTGHVTQKIISFTNNQQTDEEMVHHYKKGLMSKSSFNSDGDKVFKV